MATITLSGALLGNVVTFPLSGVLCQCGFAGGWPSVFYVSGEEGGGRGRREGGGGRGEEGGGGILFVQTAWSYYETLHR